MHSSVLLIFVSGYNNKKIKIKKNDCGEKIIKKTTKYALSIFRLFFLECISCKLARKLQKITLFNVPIKF